jgi:hypothetical protein
VFNAKKCGFEIMGFEGILDSFLCFLSFSEGIKVRALQRFNFVQKLSYSLKDASAMSQ